MLNKALLDTTVFTDAALKQTAGGIVARKALKATQVVLLPVYALKEFKAGPLQHYVWLHNKALVANRYEHVFDAVISILPFRPRRASTVLTALRDFETSIANALPHDWSISYPGDTQAAVRLDELRIWLKTKIMVAWKRRRKMLANLAVMGELSCYQETDLKVDRSGAIDDQPRKCDTDDCALRRSFRRPELDKLIAACGMCPDTRETRERKKALKRIRRLPDRELPENYCIALGDAVFAIQCPKDAVVLTTNVKDHKPLAEALGKRVCTPTEIVNDQT